jgi:hypothetical protein
MKTSNFSPDFSIAAWGDSGARGLAARGCASKLAIEGAGPVEPLIKRRQI